MSTLQNKILSSAGFVLCVCACFGFAEILEFNRQQVLSGGIWRLLTGHWVHTNMQHLILNVAASLLIYFSFFSQIKTSELLVCSFVFSILISVLLLFIYPDLQWYNGLSGLLHALVAYFSLRQIYKGNNLYWIGIFVVWLKVIAESVQAGTGHINLIDDMLVINQAHLVGVFVATVAAMIRPALPFDVVASKQY